MNVFRRKVAMWLENAVTHRMDKLPHKTVGCKVCYLRWRIVQIIHWVLGNPKPLRAK